MDLNQKPVLMMEALYELLNHALIASASYSWTSSAGKLQYCRLLTSAIISKVSIQNAVFVLMSCIFFLCCSSHKLESFITTSPRFNCEKSEDLALLKGKLQVQSDSLPSKLIRTLLKRPPRGNLTRLRNPQLKRLLKLKLAK